MLMQQMPTEEFHVVRDFREDTNLRLNSDLMHPLETRGPDYFL